VAAGTTLRLALRSDGTVVVWGDQDNPRAVPAGLTGVGAIAGGVQHCVALRADGTVIAWGFDSEGQVSIPAGLGGVTRIAAGSYHNLALRDALSPEQAIRDLRADVTQLGVPVREALRVQLDLALAALFGSNRVTACRSLLAFSRTALAQRGRQLGREQADYFIAQAADIRALIGCR
jgi:hypothetical protein